MEKKKTRKYSVYNTLYQALRRAKITNPGATASFLLEAFLEDHGRIYASKAVSYGLCNDGAFKSWRDRLVKEGWLQFDYSEARTHKDFAAHRPGTKLIHYLDKEISVYSLAERQLTLEEKTKEHSNEIADLKAKVNELEALWNNVAERYFEENPPDTKERRAKLKAIAKATGRLELN